MGLKTKLFTSQHSFEKFIDGVLLNEMNERLDRSIVRDNIVLDKYSKNFFDAYMEDGCYIQNIEINGPVLVSYKIVSSLSVLRKAIEQYKQKISFHENLLFIIYGISEEDIRDNIERIDNVYFFADETIEGWIKKYPIDYIKSHTLDRLYNNVQVNQIDIDDFINYNTYVITKLKNDIRTGDFAIVLGAGVSSDYGALSWDKLVLSFEKDINKLIPMDFDRQIKRKIGSTDLIHAQLYKELLPSDRFYKRIYSSLYEKFLPKLLKKDTTLYELGRLLERYSKKRNIKVLTYNYDDFYEQYLNKFFKNIKYKVFYTPEESLQDSIPIYHIHGYLPYSEPINQSYKDSIKLTEDDYNFLYNSPYSWQIETQLETFRKNNCLFVGCSLTDPNIRRLLKLALESKKRHYTIMRIGKMSPFELVIISHHFSKMGVNIIWTKDFKDFPELLKKI